MFDKLEALVHRFEKLEHDLSQEGLVGKDLIKISKERASLEDIVSTFLDLKRLKKERLEAKQLVEESRDSDLIGIAKEELDSLAESIEKREAELKILMLPKDPRDEKNIILEIRAGTGGDESCLFAENLLRMYSRYAQEKRWTMETMSMAEGAVGGFKEVIMMISGDNVYSHLKYESGTHRVQRVPDTETQGRVHTSACTVAIIPEADEVEVNIDPKDLEITTCRASGAGGQHINKTDSAIRIVHIPTNTVVECQDERSQHKNKAKAMKVLASRIHEKAQREQDAAISADRKSQVGSGDRSERIRTYNFPQGRVTDHRIGLTLYSLADFMDGKIDEVLDGLLAYHQAELMKEEFGA